MASEPSLPGTSDELSALLHPRLAKRKMVSRTWGVMLFERGIQLKRWARHVREPTHTSSSWGSRGPNGGDEISSTEGGEIMIEGGFVGVERRGWEGVPNGER